MMHRSPQNTHCSLKLNLGELERQHLLSGTVGSMFPSSRSLFNCLLIWHFDVYVDTQSLWHLIVNLSFASSSCSKLIWMPSSRSLLASIILLIRLEPASVTGFVAVWSVPLESYSSLLLCQVLVLLESYSSWLKVSTCLPGKG